jgi:twinkle protein
MSKIVVRNQPCLDQVDCKSSDARQVYEGGTSFCFACRKWANGDEQEFEKAVKHEMEEVSQSVTAAIERAATLPRRPIPERKISRAVTEFYNIGFGFDTAGKVSTHYYPYDGGKAFKKRVLPKSFSWLGSSTGLFGRSLFNGGGKRIIITEGEIDTLSIAQAVYDKYRKFYPVVGLSSSVMTKSLLDERDWLRTFGEVVICFDNDEAGKKATAEAIKIIGADKAKLVKLPTNDANDMLMANGSQALMQCIFDAEAYMPSGIIGKEEIWESLVKYNDVPSIPYPSCLTGVNTKLKGMRSGEITLLISGTGSGKSTILREVMLDLIENHPDTKVGIVSLEESPAETARKLAGMVIERNPANEEIELADLKVGFDAVFGDDRVVVLDHQGSINDSSIIDKLEYMCLSGCTHLFIDHITILVSEGVDKLTGNEAQDKIMNELLRLAKRYPVWIGLVSHLRKTQTGGTSFEEGKLPSLDDIRGSGSVKQVSFDIISFARNLTAEDDEERNTIKMRILKSRYTGLTGNVRGARYIYETGRLKAAEDEIVEDFVII